MQPLVDPPVVSVLLPIFNGERYLTACLESLLGQTESRIEIIAVDDGSTDASPYILDEFAKRSSTVKLLRQPNAGIVQALNKALDQAKAPWIARMDADDIASPDRFRRQIDYLEENPAVGILGSSVRYIDALGRRLCETTPPADHEAIVSRLLKGDGQAIVHPTMMARRDALIECGGYQEPHRHIEDLDLYLRVAQNNWKLANLIPTLLDYRLHDSSVNARHLQLQAELKRNYLVGLPPIDGKLPDLDAMEIACNSLPRTRADALRRLAHLATRGGESRLAMHYLWSAAINEPWSPSNLIACWRQWRLAHNQT